MNQTITPNSFQNWCQDPNRETLVMGIVNVTPDSFSDGGQFYHSEKAVLHAIQLIEDGADIIDIGGESSRPGANHVLLQEELERTIPVIQKIRQTSPDTLISIDTYKSEVAIQAIEAGANMINDISGLTMDETMPNIAADLGVPIVIMHMQGTPANMQVNPRYEDLILDITSFFSGQIKLADTAGIKMERIILDPGIGFGKTIDHNFQLIQNLNEFCKLGYPILIGPSRKSFIGTTLDLPPEDRLEGTSAVVTAGIMNGARIVRVHDVKEIKRVVTITEKIRTAA